MQSCQPTHYETRTNFKFIPYEILVNNFIEFKENLFEKYQAQKHEQLRNLIIDAILRQIKMNPTGLENKYSFPLFNEEGKAIVFTGLLMQLKNQINDYFDLANSPSSGSFMSVIKSLIPVYSRRERLEFNKKMDAVIGLNPKNQLDKEACYKINCFVKQFEISEKNEEDFTEKTTIPDSRSSILSAYDETETKRDNQSQTLPRPNRY
jgi:hypothetical protein